MRDIHRVYRIRKRNHSSKSIHGYFIVLYFARTNKIDSLGRQLFRRKCSEHSPNWSVFTCRGNRSFVYHWENRKCSGKRTHSHPNEEREFLLERRRRVIWIFIVIRHFRFIVVIYRIFFFEDIIVVRIGNTNCYKLTQSTFKRKHLNSEKAIIRNGSGFTFKWEPCFERRKSTPSTQK